MTDAAHIIEASGLSFAYRPDKPVLRGVDLRSTPKRLTAILGPNGSGKTTTLRCLLGRLRPDDGSVLLDGREIRCYSPVQLARLLAYVPQFPHAAFSFSVAEIVLMGRYAHTGALGLAGQSDRAVAREAMKMTDTLRFADRTLDELSGGEAQCVMIARALAQQPAVMLLDEPTSQLDVRNQLAIYRMMQRLAYEWEMAVVCVSHDVNLAARFADELVLMRDGRVLASGPPGEVIRAETIEAVYDVKVELIQAGDAPVPMVVAH